MAVKISEALNPEQRLWRYMSLDKLIDMFATRSLYMASTTQFRATDPYEGQNHPQVIQIWAEVMRPSYEKHRAALRQAEIDARERRVDPEALARFREELDGFPEEMEGATRKIANSVRMSCWHGNDGESEAMWKLYGESGKSVAVVTTVGCLAQSVHVGMTEEVVDIVPVKYLDFERQYPTSELKDFRGRISVTKRLAYQHEQEVRMTIRPAPSDPKRWKDPDFGKPDPVRLPVDLGELIREIHISPYPSPPFEASVRAVCGLFGIETESIRVSSLLTYQPASLAQYLTGAGHSGTVQQTSAQEKS